MSHRRKILCKESFESNNDYQTGTLPSHFKNSIKEVVVKQEEYQEMPISKKLEEIKQKTSMTYKHIKKEGML